MTQRIRPDSEKYSDTLSVLHKMLQAAMKCKQGIDLANVQTLRSLLKSLKFCTLVIVFIKYSTRWCSPQAGLKTNNPDSI
jgi:hypothetical protein